MPKQDKPRFHKLLGLTVTGGFMDGLNVKFAPGLNCIIGGRGAGKTTFLELIRYALDELPEDRAARSQFQALIKRNLGYGTVELSIETSSGIPYIVTRSNEDAPKILTQDRKPTDLVLRAGALFKADIYSQNEVESIADRSDSQLALIDSFDPSQIADLTAKADQAAHDITGIANEILQAQYGIEKLIEITDELPNILADLSGMSASTAGQAGAVNHAHAMKGLRDREVRVMEQLRTRISKHQEGLSSWLGAIGQEAEDAISQEILAGPNAAMFRKAQAAIKDSSKVVDAHLQEILQSVETCMEDLNAQSKALLAAHGAQDLKYQEFIDTQNVAREVANKRMNLERRRNELLAKEQELKSEKEKLAKLEERRQNLIGMKEVFRDKRFALRKSICEYLTNATGKEVRVTVAMDGNRQFYREKLDELLRGSSIQSSSKEKVIGNLFPQEIVEVVRSRNATELAERAGLSNPIAGRIITALADHPNLHELEIVDLVDEPKIELKDGDDWKDSRQLSTGQKCTAILPILLVESEKPLLIDQPEDNLDNRYVSDKIVKTITAVKKRRQFIFVTHNPNIPVLGDADQVVVLTSSGSASRVDRHGSVDDCKSEIVNLLEGGKEAFKKRSKRYDIRSEQ